jgi:hypothetical protein
MKLHLIEVEGRRLVLKLSICSIIVWKGGRKNAKSIVAVLLWEIAVWVIRTCSLDLKLPSCFISCCDDLVLVGA